MIEWIPNNFACNSYNGKILITIRFEFNDTSFNSDTFLEIRNVAALSQKCTIRRNLSIASLVGRLQEKYRRISLPRTKLLTRWRISMAYELPVDLAQIRFASQKKSGGGGRREALERYEQTESYFSPIELEYIDEKLFRWLQYISKVYWYFLQFWYNNVYNDSIPHLLVNKHTIHTIYVYRYFPMHRFVYCIYFTFPNF